MTLRARTILIVTLAVALVLLLAGYVGHSASERLREALSQARDVHLLNTFRAHAEYRLALGLTLDQIDGLQPLIERERASAPAVVSIDIFSAPGVLAYSTDRSAVGTTVAPAWVKQIQMADAWRFDESTERVAGTRLENDLGEAVGGVAVTLAKPADPHALLARLFSAAARERGPLVGLAAVCVLLAGLCVGLVVRRLLAPYRATAALLRAPPAIGPGGPGGAAQAAAGSLVPATAAFAHQAASRREVWATSGTVIATGLAALREMDDAS